MSFDSRDLASAQQAGASLRCPRCGVVRPAMDWRWLPDALCCYECDHHGALQCPACSRVLDWLAHDIRRVPAPAEAPT